MQFSTARTLFFLEILHQHKIAKFEQTKTSVSHYMNLVKILCMLKTSFHARILYKYFFSCKEHSALEFP